MNTRSIGWSLILIALIVGTATAVEAFAMQHGELGMGGGISTPSSSNALQDNPAALIYNRGARINAQALSENDKFSPVTAEGRLLYGHEHFLGVAAGAHTYKDGGTTNYAADYGAGLYLSTIYTSIGASATSRLKNTPAVAGKKNDYSLTALFNPYGNARLGAGFMNLVGGLKNFVVGASADVAPHFTLGVDGSSHQDLKGVTVIPAAGIHFGVLELSAGYGFRANRQKDSFYQDKWTAGGGFKLGHALEVEYRYRHKNLHAVSLSASF